MESTNRFSSLWFAGGVGTLLAVIFAVAVYLLADAAGDPLSVSSQPGSDDFMKLSIGVVIGATIVAGLVATGIAWISKKTGSPVVVFLVAVVIGFLVMLFPPISSAEQSSTTAWLIVMHTVVAAPIIASLVTHLRIAGADEVVADGS